MGMETWIVPTLVLAVAVGALAGWWFTYARAKLQIASLRVDVADRDATVAEMQAKLAELQGQVTASEAKVAGLQAQRDAAVARAEDVVADRTSLEDRFKAITAEQLARQSEHTTQQLVEPVSEGLKLLTERIQAVERERTAMSTQLRTQIASLHASGEALRKETLGLASALRTPQVRGSWGEQSLRRMVEVSGLTARVDFDEQTSSTNDEGALRRPDMRIHLAGGKEIFVDSKVPLAAVLEAYNTDDEAEQAQHLERFARHVRKHIDDLSSKHYWDLSLASPEFVVLFLGSDEFYRLAQERMPDLHDYAARRNVMLASPGILIPMLHIVAHGWSQASLAESAKEVVELGRNLHTRIATMGGHFAAASRGLNQAVVNYNKALASLESRVLVTARKFTDLDVTKAGLDTLGTVTATATSPSAPELSNNSLALTREDANAPE